jgi:hypothetical protein
MVSYYMFYCAYDNDDIVITHSILQLEQQETGSLPEVPKENLRTADTCDAYDCKGDGRMRKTLNMVSLISSLNLAACQTIAMINGVTLPIHPAQGGDTFCERNFAICVAAGALAGGGIAFAASGRHGTPSDLPAISGGGGGSRGGTPPRGVIP